MGLFGRKPPKPPTGENVIPFGKRQKPDLPFGSDPTAPKRVRIRLRPAAPPSDPDTDTDGTSEATVQVARASEIQDYKGDPRGPLLDVLGRINRGEIDPSGVMVLVLEQSTDGAMDSVGFFTVGMDRIKSLGLIAEVLREFP